MIIKQICKSSTPIRSGPSSQHGLENELLFGEKIEIHKISDSWAFCKALHDCYMGWVNINDLSDITKVNHRVINLRSNLYEKDNIKSKILFHLPLGSKLNIIKKGKKWCKIKYYNKNLICDGYVPISDIVNINNKCSDWVSIAESLINTPYKWGGRDSHSIDCSALIQLSLETINILFPRDTKDQVNFLNYENLKQHKRGTLIFWNGHVGAMVDQKNIIHANAFHMKVKIEPLAQVEKRAQKDGFEITKIMNLHSQY